MRERVRRYYDAGDLADTYRALYEDGIAQPDRGLEAVG